MIGLGLPILHKKNISFTPTVIPNMSVWYRADLGITLSGSNVVAIADQSGSGDTNKNLGILTASFVGAQAVPTYTASNSGYNNQPTLQFNGNQTLISGIWGTPLVQPSTWYIVAGTSDSSTESTLFDDYTQTMRIDTVGMNAGNEIGPGTQIFYPNKVVVCVVFNGSSSALYVSALTATSTGDAGSHGMNKFILAAAGGINTSQFGVSGAASTYDGTIAEILAYSGAHSSTTQSQIMNYLGVRYTITIGA